MLAILACFLASQVPIDQPPRLRTVLPNGAAVLVERIPGAKTLALDLFASSRGTEETPITNGLRHLLEHLVAKGPKGDLDIELESAGAFMSAETSREAMIFKFNLPPDQLKLGLKAVTAIMQMPPVTSENIKNEAMILEQEAALQESSSKLSGAGWMRAYGDQGLDPIGNLDVIRNATPAMLDPIHRTQFLGSNLVITVVGDVDLDEATKLCSAVLAKAPKGEPIPQLRKPTGSGETPVDAPGEAVAVAVPGFQLPETAAKLAVALAIASEADRCFVFYTPTIHPGLITIGRTEDPAGLLKIVNRSTWQELFTRGKALGILWVRRLIDTPEHIAYFRGQLISARVDLKPEMLLENLNSMSQREFADALESFRSSQRVLVIGK